MATTLKAQSELSRLEWLAIWCSGSRQTSEYCHHTELWRVPLLGSGIATISPAALPLAPLRARLGKCRNAADTIAVQELAEFALDSFQAGVDFGGGGAVLGFEPAGLG